MTIIMENIVSLITMKKKLPFKTFKTPQLFYLLGIAVLLSSCVPQRKYAELEAEYHDLIESNNRCKSELAMTNNELNDIEAMANKIFAKNAELNAKYTEMEAMFSKVKDSYEILGENYRKLIESKSEDLARLDKELKDLETKLSNRDTDLTNKEADLIEQQKRLDKLALDVEKLRISLELREKKVTELQAVIQKKDEAFKSLTSKIKEALLGQGAKGLTVVNKDGKIFVSVESQLLFKPGRTDIDSKGESTLLNLAAVLANLDDIEVIVEGHTDKNPIKTARFTDNWDLSVLRATSVVRVLIDKGNLSPSLVVPSGRAQHIPVDKGSSVEAYAKNRRIEIIISPNLKEVFDLIQK
jgi:chemotaxis protein MotB